MLEIFMVMFQLYVLKCNIGETIMSNSYIDKLLFPYG